MSSNELYRKPGVLEITKGWAFSYKVSQYHDQYSLIISVIYLTFYISLPNYGYDFDNWDRSWGFYWYGSSLNFHWGKKHKCFYAPWSWEHVRHEVLFADGLRKPPGNSWDKKDGRLVEKHLYTYTRKNGEVQRRSATVCIEEREWRWRWFRWLPWPRKICRVIDVEFDEEIGERCGTWKGGTVGCGWDMLPGETMEQTLRRMEAEREFR